MVDAGWQKVLSNDFLRVQGGPGCGRASCLLLGRWRMLTPTSTSERELPGLSQAADTAVPHQSNRPSGCPTADRPRSSSERIAARASLPPSPRPVSTPLNRGRLWSFYSVDTRVRRIPTSRAYSLHTGSAVVSTALLIQQGVPILGDKQPDRLNFHSIGALRTAGRPLNPTSLLPLPHLLAAGSPCGSVAPGPFRDDPVNNGRRTRSPLPPPIKLPGYLLFYVSCSSFANWKILASKCR